MTFSTRKAISFKVHVKGCPGLSLRNREAPLGEKDTQKHGIIAEGAERISLQVEISPVSFPFFIKL